MTSIHTIIPMIGKGIIHILISIGFFASFFSSINLNQTDNTSIQKNNTPNSSKGGLGDLSVNAIFPLLGSDFSSKSALEKSIAPSQNNDSSIFKILILNQNENISSSTNKTDKGKTVIKIPAQPTATTSNPLKELDALINKVYKNVEPNTPTDNTSLPQSNSTNPTITQNLNPSSNISDSTVNIICTNQVGNNQSMVSGSGAIITEQGNILTNAHVAEYLLLVGTTSGQNLKCSIRAGTTAQTISNSPTLIYISPTWVESNYKCINDPSKCLETGENDFAILSISNLKTGNTYYKLPGSGQYQNLQSGTSINITGYPAGSKSYQQVLNGLGQQSENLNIQSTFNIGTFISSPSTIGQIGLSGSPITNNAGFVGIVTSILSSNISTKYTIQGLSIGQINNEITSETGNNLNTFLSNQIAQNHFSLSTKPNLVKLLSSAR